LKSFAPWLKAKRSFNYCGPTVWDFGHIGKFPSAIAADVLRRYLKFKGFRSRT
jgi:cysteinyl-tRNA synthetase